MSGVMSEPQVSVAELLELLGKATAEAYAWQRDAARLAARLAELEPAPDAPSTEQE